MFSGKGRAYLSKAHLKCPITLTANIRIDCKCLQRSNTIFYLVCRSIIEKVLVHWQNKVIFKCLKHFPNYNNFWHSYVIHEKQFIFYVFNQN